jgi:prephenate dehydrogenase
MNKIFIIGDGSFGTFLMDLLDPHFEVCLSADKAESIILAVPVSAYNEIGERFKDKHLVNVCSVQKPTTDILLKHTDRVTSIHPLFGKRTPADKRNSILTYTFDRDNGIEAEFLSKFGKISNVHAGFTPESHDILMAKTHASALMAAKQLQVFTDRVKDVPDYLIPNSFRLMREFVKTLEDMPAGTVESILTNPYI